MESYQGQSVGSLYLHALESIYWVGFVVQGQKLFLDGKEMPVNQQSEFEYKWLHSETRTYISLLDLLNGDVPADRVWGKYIVFGYDGKDTHQIETPEGEMDAHLDTSNG